MRRQKIAKRVVLGLSIALAGGTLLDNGCINTLASIPVCGTVLAFCTPQDQLNLMYGMLEVPNYDWDPSCTVPYGCGDGDLFVDGVPGGSAPAQPSQSQSGTGG
jgi:hypothetical protein